MSPMTVGMIALAAIALPLLAWILMRMWGKHWWVAAIALTPLYLLIGWWAHTQGQALHDVYESTEYRTADDIIHLANRMDMYDAIATTTFALAAVCAGVMVALTGQWVWRRLHPKPPVLPPTPQEERDARLKRVTGLRLKGLAYAWQTADRLDEPKHRPGETTRLMLDALDHTATGQSSGPADMGLEARAAHALVSALTDTVPPEDEYEHALFDAARLVIDNDMDVDKLSRIAKVDDLERTPGSSIMLDGTPEGTVATALWLIVNTGDTKACLETGRKFDNPAARLAAAGLAGLAYGVEDNPFTRRMPESQRKPLREATDGLLKRLEERGAWWRPPYLDAEPVDADVSTDDAANDDEAAA